MRDVKSLHKKLGPLGEDESYYPKVDPAIGGSLKLSTFTTGNVYVRSDVLGQNRGIE
eukprot:CAMPEP_0194221606 /NCGR_PEP_ID=MMETSP0156-20130528/30970_1 /TAXON_ID=33649 /ORGANISM="Thalassionema nitzschioides, Strain L26-B" /LENGTH=56 /DNA_ID=CAMNT_0038952067 /DNA_START=253 /DNA_END=423 /DNA_ORIENTATION=+